jgi:hypothetical protein
MPEIDAPALAARVQGLIHARFGGDVSAAARELGVAEKDVRDIVERATDHPSLDALAAIVRRFGIDACWLLTGEYDWASHRRQLTEEEEHDDDAPRKAILRLVAPEKTTSFEPLKRSA